MTFPPELLLLATHLSTGAFTTETAGRAGLLLLLLPLGILLGERIHARLSERTFRVLVYGLLLVAGASILLRAW